MRADAAVRLDASIARAQQDALDAERAVAQAQERLQAHGQKQASIEPSTILHLPDALLASIVAQLAPHDIVRFLTTCRAALDGAADAAAAIASRSMPHIPQRDVLSLHLAAFAATKPPFAIVAAKLRAIERSIDRTSATDRARSKAGETISKQNTVRASFVTFEMPRARKVLIVQCGNPQNAAIVSTWSAPVKPSSPVDPVDHMSRRQRHHDDSPWWWSTLNRIIKPS